MYTKVACKFCAGRCGLLIRRDGERIVHIKGDPAHPVSRGWTCARGRAATVKYIKAMGTTTLYTD